MTRISIVLEEPAFKTLLVYYWHQLPTNEYAVVFVCVFLFQGIAEVLALVLSIRFIARRRPQWLVNILLTAAFLVSGCMAGYTLLLADAPHTVAYWAGLGLFSCAYIGRDLTHALLKPKYSSCLEMALNERAVISGVFALIRYPLSALYLLEMAAFPLIAWNGVSATMLAIACFGLLWKIPREEQRLALEFGERFAAYRRTTKRMIPFVY